MSARGRKVTIILVFCKGEGGAKNISRHEPHFYPQPKKSARIPSTISKIVTRRISEKTREVVVDCSNSAWHWLQRISCLRLPLQSSDSRKPPKINTNRFTRLLKGRAARKSELPHLGQDDGIALTNWRLWPAKRGGGRRG